MWAVNRVIHRETYPASHFHASRRPVSTSLVEICAQSAPRGVKTRGRACLTLTRAYEGEVGAYYLTYLWFYWSDLDKLGLILKLRISPIGLASPWVPASPGMASPRVQKVGLLPALVCWARSGSIICEHARKKIIMCLYWQNTHK